MHKTHITILLLLALFCGMEGYAQTFETGGVLGLDYDLKLMKGWHATFEGEARANSNFTHLDRAKLAVGTHYMFWKKRVRVGAAYNFLAYHSREDQVFDLRHRVKGFVTISPKFGPVKLSYRAMAQTTFRDERRGSYKFNPKTYMRNRLALTWSLPESPVKLYVSEEFWWRLYKPGDNIIDHLRSVAGVVYDINKHHSLDFHIRFDHDVQVSNPERILYFGIVYGID